MVAHVCSLGVGEVKTGACLGFINQSVFRISTFQASERPCPRKQGRQCLE